MKHEAALEVYEVVCQALDEMKWKYQRHEEKLVVTFGVSGEDMPMDFLIHVDEERSVVRLQSRIPVTVPEEKRLEFNAAISHASYALNYGGFDYDFSKGTVIYRHTITFLGSKLRTDAIKILIHSAVATVDKYNDRLFALSKGFLTLEKFLNEK